MSVLRLIQFTDPHLYGSEGESLRGVPTLPALRAALAHARARDWPPDALLVTGDIGHAHRHAGMAGVGALHGVHGERADGVGEFAACSHAALWAAGGRPVGVQAAIAPREILPAVPGERAATCETRNFAAAR